ncbi:MAG: formylmethanofuran dehydrogenase [Desulfobulbaceae bacterium BRH_c16a]|nr:MAG: formylmethanofuran dehydrogenase [Desulfobulbaceae bacterium BRH_c16a]
MSAQTILASDLFKKCLDFHGHLCPGLSLGYQAAVAGMEWLSARRAEDEEVVAIVETDACGCDAIQVVTGCTFGKGNFIYRDYGKTAFTFFNRKTGQGVRVARKAEQQDPIDPEHRQLLAKIRQGTATDLERSLVRAKHEKASKRILDLRPYELFTISEITVPAPEKARIEPSLNCAVCGEPTMSTKMVEKDGQSICRGCLG